MFARSRREWPSCLQRPRVVNFNDPLHVKVVQLDAICRQQQVAEAWFENIASVPESALSPTIPTFLRVPKLIVSVPGNRKAKIIRRTFEKPIAVECPATILRTHPDVTVYLDVDPAAELDGLEKVGISLSYCYDSPPLCSCRSLYESRLELSSLSPSNYAVCAPEYIRAHRISSGAYRGTGLSLSFGSISIETKPR